MYDIGNQLFDFHHKMSAFSGEKGGDVSGLPSHQEDDAQRENVNETLSNEIFSNLKNFSLNIFKRKIKKANPHRSDDLVDRYKERLKQYYYYRFGLSSLSAIAYLIFFLWSDGEILLAILSPIFASI